MWRKLLSWVALAANVLAVIINVGLMAYVWFAEATAAQNPVFRLIGILIVGAFLLAGPVVSIFAVLVGAPILRRDPAPQTAALFE